MRAYSKNNYLTILIFTMNYNRAYFNHNYCILTMTHTRAYFNNNYLAIESLL